MSPKDDKAISVKPPTQALEDHVARHDMPGHGINPCDRVSSRRETRTSVQGKMAAVRKKKKKKKVDCEWHVQESWCSITYSDTIVAHA